MRDKKSNNIDKESREVVLLAKNCWRSRRALILKRKGGAGNPVQTFSVGSGVLIIHVKAMQQAVKWLAFQTEYLNPCIVTKEGHPHYKLRSSAQGRNQGGPLMHVVSSLITKDLKNYFSHRTLCNHETYSFINIE